MASDGGTIKGVVCVGQRNLFIKICKSYVTKKEWNLHFLNHRHACYMLPVLWGKHLRYACGYWDQGKCYVKTRRRRRREGRITERRHELGLDRRVQHWNRKYEKRTDKRNKKGTNIIYCCNTMKITEHGLRPVTLQNSVVAIVILPILLLFFGGT